MKHIYTMTYETFIKEMLNDGFTWDEVEYYWRNPEEYERMLRNEEENYMNSTSSTERAYWDYINNI